METGILYAIIAGLFWGTSPVLVKRGLVNSDVSAATLIQQAAILFTLILFPLLEGSVATGQISTVSMLVFIAIGIVGALATICYGLVPVMKKFATDSGGSPMLGALTIHATGLLLLLTLGSLLKIELKWQRVALPSFLCFAFAGVLQAIGSGFTLNALLFAPASVVAPIWNTQPIISFFLARVTLKGIEVVTFRDGIAAALVVMGVLVMRWA